MLIFLVSGSLPKQSEQYRSRNRSQEDRGLPNVNIQLIHTILAVPDEENSKRAFLLFIDCCNRV